MLYNDKVFTFKITLKGLDNYLDDTFNKLGYNRDIATLISDATNEKQMMSTGMIFEARTMIEFKQTL